MDEEKQESRQVIIHKSDWASQVIKVIVVLLLIAFSIKSNPTKKDFIAEVISQLAKSKGKLDLSTSNAIGELGSNEFSEYIEPFVKRRDFLLFSYYEVDLKNDKFEFTTSAFGIWNSIFLDEESSKLILNKKKEIITASTPEPIDNPY